MSCRIKKHTLLSLLQGVDYTLVADLPEAGFDSFRVSDVTADSRRVLPGAVFVALVGEGVDGHDYIDHAVGCGAECVVCLRGRGRKIQKECSRPLVIEVEDTYLTYARLCANYFGNPGDRLKLAAVTGTNGKTTVTYIAEDILIAAGKGVGVVGTVNNRYTTAGGQRTVLPTRFTTPEAYELQQVLAEMVDGGVEYVVMEVSSHALAQDRVGTLLFDVAAFTNLSRDHLDYHHGMDAYFEAKLILFRRYLQKGAVAVLPGLDGHSELNDKMHELHCCCRDNNVPVISWGKGLDADVKLVSHSSRLDSTRLQLEIAGQPVALDSLLVGDFNIENVLVSIALCKGLGIDQAAIVEGVAKTVGAPGRLQRIEPKAWSSAGPTVFVDYAHTPDALEKVLTTVQALPHGELYGVFGCGGDRDAGKRPVMGGIGAGLCNVSIITDDNPRTEEPAAIVAAVLQGAKKAGCRERDISWLRGRSVGERGCLVLRDRREAIAAAIKNGREGDIVVIAGKGHEPYQLTINGKKYFDDRDEAKDALLSWTPSIVARATSGKISGGPEEDILLGSVVTDSRVPTEKGIFVALRGENHDAHSYASQAVENGAACLVVERELAGMEAGVVQIITDDTTRALGDLAAFRRQAFVSETSPFVLGLTGSCGKTTVKEMIASILQRKYPAGPDFPEDSVLKTGGNFNNLIGLPISLLPLGMRHRAAVLEMGMNVPGEIARLAEIADPDISCITNVHGAHLLGLGTIEGVADAKEELFRATKASGTLIVNLDDERIAARAEKYSQKKITFGVDCIDNGLVPDIWASDIAYIDGGAITYVLHHRDASHEIHLYIAGTHNVVNSLCAAAMGLAAGCSFEQIALGLADFRAPDKRMELHQSKYGFEILNDTYNANPASMEAGMRALVETAKGRTVAVVGDMLELGDAARSAHYNVGRCAVELKINFLLCYGEWSGETAKGFLENGGAPENLFVADEKDEIVRRIEFMAGRGDIGADDLVLVKASRGLKFETIVESLKL